MAWISVNQRVLKQIDWWLVGAVLVLTAFGILVIDGTTYAVQYKEHFAKRQAQWWAVSIVAFVIVLFFDYSQLTKLAAPIYVVCLLLVAGLKIKGIVAGGAESWYDLRIGRLQPSEFCKLATVMVVAAYLARIKVRLPGWFDLVVVTVLVLLPFLLIAMQPDLGTAVVFLPLIVVMPWVAGASPSRRVCLIFGAVAFAAIVAYGTAVVLRNGDFPLLNKSQERRLKGFAVGFLPSRWADSDRIGIEAAIRERVNYQPRHSLIALGSGRLSGKGWRRGTQTRLEFLPAAHTDYIFASCGEQFGFAGCAFVLALYTFLVYRSLFLALRSKDWFGYLIVLGFLTIFVTHVALNIGVATDLLPVTGLPLPFLSYGGTFLLTMYIGFGLVVNVGMRKYMF